MLRRQAPVFALFFLAPFIAEFLLGDFPLTDIALILFLAPLYGGGALLIREMTRRTGRGWPTIVLLALAYGVLEEGLLTQSLFNPNYVGDHLLAQGYVKPLGIAIPWTILVLTLHTAWSISTPIALVEESAYGRRTQPWIKGPGLLVVTVLFLVGCAATFATSYADKQNGHHYMASPAKLTAAAVVVAALVIVAFLLPKPASTDRAAASPASASLKAPSPWIVLATTLVAGALFEMARGATAVRVGMMLVAIAAMLVLTAIWSRRAGWGRWHRHALAAGATLTYAWNAFTTSPIGRTSPSLKLLSHVVFALCGLLILAYATTKVRRQGDASIAASGGAAGAGGAQPDGAEPARV